MFAFWSTPPIFLKSGEWVKNVWVTGKRKNECVQVIETAWFIGVRIRERARFWEVGAEGLEVRRRRKGQRRGAESAKVRGEEGGGLGGGQ